MAEKKQPAVSVEMRGIRLENFEAETHFIDVRHVLVDTMVNAGGNQNGLADCRLAQAETCLDCTDAAGDVVKLKNRMPVEICRGFFQNVDKLPSDGTEVLQSRNSDCRFAALRGSLSAY